MNAMRSEATSLLPVLFMAVTLTVSAQGQGGSNSPGKTSTPSADQLVTIDMQKATLSDVVAELGQKYNVNIVTDAFIPDVIPLGGVKMINVPLRVAVPKLAQLFHRQMMVDNGIAIWRAQSWYSMARQDEYSMQHYHMKWKDAGYIIVQRLDGTPPSTKTGTTVGPSPGATAAKLSEISVASSTGGAEQNLLPARIISVEVSQASARDVASKLSTEVGWSVKVEQGLAERRVNTQVHNVTPSQMLGALTFLFNAAQTVAIGQTGAQHRQEDAAFAQRSDTRSAREKASDDLKRKLTSLLNEQQINSLQNGEPVVLAIGDLPPGLQQQAIQYAQTAADQLAKSGVAPDTLPDPNQVSNSSISVAPDPGQALGVRGVTAGGVPVWY